MRVNLERSQSCRPATDIVALPPSAWAMKRERSDMVQWSLSLKEISGETIAKEIQPHAATMRAHCVTSPIDHSQLSHVASREMAARGPMRTSVMDLFIFLRLDLVSSRYCAALAPTDGTPQPPGS
jgi:hypothetical protein